MKAKLKELHCCANCHWSQFNLSTRLDEPYCVCPDNRDRGDIISLAGLDLEIFVCDGWKTIEE